jgi:hypothetical protein
MLVAFQGVMKQSSAIVSQAEGIIAGRNAAAYQELNGRR